MTRFLVTLGLAVVVSVPSQAMADGVGIVLLAHGGSPEWNSRVVELARKVDVSQPVEVAFGMATRRTIQAAIDRLAARGVTSIVAVPLFVSSWSSVMASTEYLLGLRFDAPAALAVFAGMDHADPSAAGPKHPDHGDLGESAATAPVVSKIPIVGMSPALDAHPIVAGVLATRARSISRNPAQESVIVVAHGPVSDEENQLWLRDMRSLAAGLGTAEPFASIDVLTLRDDAPKAVRDQATSELRALVIERQEQGRRVLIVPLLVSFGGIEEGIAERLHGLPYSMTASGLMPDDRLVTWILEMARRPF
jgi:sirohydrochlorin ferrochelatase